MFFKFSDKTGNRSLRACRLLYFWVTLLINFSINSQATTKYITLLDSNSPILHSTISSHVSEHDDDGLLHGNAMKSRTARRRRVLVYVEGKVLCERYCLSSFNSSRHINPLHGARVKVECKSSYGEYETVGISNRDGIFRVILHGAVGYRWPLRFCRARVLVGTVPQRCQPSRTHVRNNINEFEMNVRLMSNHTARVMLGVGPFIFQPTNISASAPCPLKAALKPLVV